MTKFNYTHWLQKKPKAYLFVIFLSGWLLRVLVLGVIFLDKLEIFCCSHHLSYDILKHFPSFASLLHLLHLLFNCWLRDSPSLTPFSSCSKHHYKPSLISRHLGHPAAFVNSGSSMQGPVVAFQTGVEGLWVLSAGQIPRTLQPLQSGHLTKGLQKSLELLPQTEEEGGGRKSAGVICKSY